jgi:hypothetical protein
VTQKRAELIKLMARSTLSPSSQTWPIETFPGALLDAEKMLAAIEAAGCRVVPVEATEAMIRKTECADSGELGFDAGLRAEWSAMLAASPFAPPQGDGA